MKNKLLMVLSLNLIVLLLSSCGKDSVSSNTKSSSNENTLTSNTTRSYRFNENGCDTGKKEFSSDTPEKTKQLMCDSLQSGTKNNFCAEYSRQQYFQAACSGQSWSPYY